MPPRNRRNNNRRSRNNRRRGGRGGGGLRQDDLSRKELAAQYGYAIAFLRSDDELFNLFQRATRNTWSIQKFQAELMDTKWFKTHSASWRQAQALKFSDRAEWGNRMHKMVQQIEAQASLNSAVMSRKMMRNMAENALMFGWTDDQINDHMSKFVRASEGGHFGGELAAVEDMIRSTAYRNGVKVSQKAMRHWMRMIVRGQMTQEDYVNHVRAHAARTFKAFGQEINAGVDLMDAASPYIQSAQEILELAPGKVDLFEPRIRQALTHKNDEGKTAPLGLAEFEERLRKDPRWRKTQNATETVMDAAYNVAKMMGTMA